MDTYCYRKDTRDLFIDVFKPEGATAPLPGIVFFFGGGWVNGTREQFKPFARDLAEHGMLAAVADYRIKSIDATDPPACVTDGKSAIRWMRAHADEIGLDGDAILAKAESPEVGQVIADNHALAKEMQISGTPTFVMNDMMLRGYLPYDGMAQRLAMVRGE